MRFFREIIKPKSVINQTAILEARKAFAEAKELQKCNNTEDLKKALFIVGKRERK